MKEYVYENLEICCNEFQKLLLIDKYISKSMIDSYLDKYQDTFNLINKNYVEKTDIIYKKVMSIINNAYNIVEKRNKVFMQRQLSQQSILKNILDKENIVLSEEQQKSIIVDDDFSLIVSGSGSGKTTSAVAKIKYLIEHDKVKSENIILISDNIKACEELNNKMSIYNLDIRAITFHELCLDLVKKRYGEEIKFADDKVLYNCIVSYVKENLFENKSKFDIFKSVFNDYVNFGDNIDKYNYYNDFYSDFCDNKYREYSNNINLYILPKLDEYKNNNITLNNEKLRSSKEVLIANYLYINNVKYTYEKKYKNNNLTDFIIYDNDEKYYLEYYALTGLNKNNVYSPYNSKYKKEYEKKHMELNNLYNDYLLEIYSDDNIIDKLSSFLSLKKIKTKSLSKKDLFYKLLNNESEIHFKSFIQLAITFINNFKEKNYKLEDFDLLIKHEYKETQKKQLLFMKDLYEYYTNYLEENNMFDFNDIASNAYNNLEKSKHDNDLSFLSYLIIDDYQSISREKYNFAQKLSKIYHSKIVALVDDYQAIFEFNESDINSFSPYYESIGQSEIIRLSSCYRSSQELIDVLSSFVGKDTSLYTKMFVSSKRMNNPIEVNYFVNKNIQSRYLTLYSILKRIYSKDKTSRILLLGQNKNDINEYINNNYFIRTNNSSLLCLDFPKANIDFLTIDESKGLEYDQVIIINPFKERDNLSYLLENDPLLRVLSHTKNEIISSPIDRKLFYIALTRSKNMVYILCPYIPSSQLMIIKEVLPPKYVKENISI